MLRLRKKTRRKRSEYEMRETVINEVDTVVCTLSRFFYFIRKDCLVRSKNRIAILGAARLSAAAFL